MNELSLFEKGLVPVYKTDKGEYVVNGRELWSGLQSKQDFSTWMKKRISECDANEYEDYDRLHKKMEANNATLIEYIIKLDAAKEMAMLERNEIGKKVRKYFIEIEKKSKQQPIPQGTDLLALAVLEAQKVLAEKNNLIAVKDQIIGELKPKADYTDTILQSKALVTITQISKDYGKSGEEMNKILHSLKVQYKQNDQWLLYANHQAKGYTHSETIYFRHKNGKQDTKMITKWTQKGRLFLYELLKKNNIIPVIEKEVDFAS